jgi:hypothetical protein
LDVIARLMSLNEDESNDFEHVLESLNFTSIFSNDYTEIDPLMGAQSQVGVKGQVGYLGARVVRFNFEIYDTWARES